MTITVEQRHVDAAERLERVLGYSHSAIPEAFARFEASLHPASDDLREAVNAVRAWVASLTVTDMNEIVADGGITAGMVVGQEAREQVRRLDAALNQTAAGERG